MPGPAPGSRCMACNHPGVVLINTLVNQGESDYKIGGQFRLPRMTLQRHRTRRHPGISEAAATRGSNLAAARAPRAPDEWGGGREEAPEFPDGGSPREQLDWLVKTLRVQAQGGDLRPDLARELRLALEAQDKMGGSEPPPVVQVRDVEGLGEMLKDMHEALKPFPEARLAMMEVWRRYRAVEDDGQGEVQGSS